MHRRTYLGAAAAAATSLAGCLGSSAPGDDTSTDDPTDRLSDQPATTAPAPAIGDTGFERKKECDEAGSASIAMYQRKPPAVSINGCIVGKNGCTVPVLSEATYDADADELRVVVATEERRDDNEVCTQALVHLGYNCTVSFEHGGPGTVVVVHDGANGRQEAARTTFE